MNPQTKASGLAVIAVGLWSTVATAFKIALRYLSPLELLAYSSLFSFLILLAFVAGRGRLGQVLSSSAADLGRSALLGLLNPFLYYVVLFAAYDRLLGQEALVLNYVWPIVLVLLSAVLLRQPLTIRSMAALLVSFAGVVMIAARGNPASMRFSDPLGVLLAVGSSVFWSLYWIYNVKDSREEALKLCLGFFFGSAASLIALLVVEGWSPPPWQGWVSALYVGLFEMGLTFLLWMKALQLSRTAALISNLVFLSPFMSLMFLHIVIGESILPSTLAGLVLIIGGIVVQRFHRS